MEKQFTVQDLERAGERGMIAGQIEVVKDIVKQARTNAQSEFNAGHDPEAIALREFANQIETLIEILDKKLNGLKSKVRAQQITGALPNPLEGTGHHAHTMKEEYAAN
jgi:hypothetical protein